MSWTLAGVGGRGVRAVNQPKCVVDTNVNLHAEVPLVALPGLVHFWITLAALILGRTRSRNNGDINNAIFTKH